MSSTRIQEPSEDRVLSWLATALASAYVLWSCFRLLRKASLFGGMFAAMGVELPVVTRIVLSLSKPMFLWPIAAAVVAVLIVKEVRIARHGVRLAISVIIFMLTASIMSLATEALFQPLFQLMRQIG